MSSVIHYDLNRIKNADLLAFSGVAFFSEATKRWTDSPTSHVGMACWIRDPVNRLMVLESMEQRGCRIISIEEWMKWKGVIDHYALREGTLDRLKVVQAGWARIGHGYASPYQLVLSFGKIFGPILRLFSKTPDTDADREHCAEFWSNAICDAGGSTPKHPAAMSPGDVVGLHQYFEYVDTVKSV